MSDQNETNVARTLAPEDIRRGMYVSITHKIEEHLPFCCYMDEFRDSQPKRTMWLPSKGGRPLKVLEPCLPFVLVERANGRMATLDVRRHRLAQLSDRYGDAVFVRAKGRRLAKKRRKRNKKKSDD